MPDDPVATAALREAITALSGARDYIHFEAPHQPTEDELRRVIGVVREALDRDVAGITPDSARSVRRD